MSETNQLWDDENENSGNSSGLSLDQELEMALAEPSSLDQELDAAFTESGSLDQELDAAFTESGSLDQELDAAFTESGSLDQELDAAFTESGSLDQELDAAFTESDSLDQELDAAFQEETSTEDTETLDDDSFASDEPAFEAEVEEPAMADVQPEPVASVGHDGNDSFNLATLTQLVDEIRQESNRVSEMKASVARALSLIQEMSESLKS